ncbi:chemotaxis protein, partial [Vibrio parahaemolyticus]
MGSSKSKSSNTSNTTNVSGQNAISGDNLGVAISGVNNSTINTTMTDHGAV